MGTGKAIILTCLAIALLLVLMSCQNHAEESSLQKVKVLTTNDTVEETKNEAKAEINETVPESVIEDDGSKQDDILLPTVAPATPVTSSFILISPSEKVSSVLHSIDADHEADHSEIPAESKRPDQHSQIDEVEFGSDAASEPKSENMPPAEEQKMVLPVILKADDSEDDSIKSTDSKLGENEEPVIDIMKYEAADNQNNTESNLAKNKFNLDSGKTENEIKVNVEEEANPIESKESKVADSTEAVETNLPDKGILESFKDWKEKQETNGKKEIIEKSVSKTPVKKRGSKKTNYASSECGAKVISSNPEAENVAAILNENRDLYMLNPCSCNIWFVIELCEKVRAETIEIANFELFSSAMEKFNVYFSTRYPTREWEHGGMFHGKAERKIQSYNMAEEYYAKYVKVEILSHFGKEHYCPLSLVRVFGRSEVEELDDSEDHTHDHDSLSEESSNGKKEETQNEIRNEGEGKNNGNFLKSARDMVIGLVNKATKSLTGIDDAKNDTVNTKHDNNDTEIGSQDEEQNKGSDNLNTAPKIIQIPDDNTDVINGSKVGSIQTEEKGKPGNNSSSNLVILLEGDDTEDETDTNTYSKYCIFNGEISLKRCANPIRKYWIEYLFSYRMCPIFSKDLLRMKNNASGKFKTENANDTNKLNNTSTNLQNTTGLKFQTLEATEQTKFVLVVTTTGGAASTPKDTSSHSSSSVVTCVKDSGKEGDEIGEQTVFKPSETESQTERIGDVTITELVKREHDEKIVSCDKKEVNQPDLSQLLNVAVSSKIEASSQIEKGKEEDAAAVEKAGTKEPAVEREDNSKNENEEGEHVDVLVINYDERLGEGKAEVPVNVNREISEQEVQSDVVKLNHDAAINDAKSDVIVENNKNAEEDVEVFQQTADDGMSVLPLKVGVEGESTASAPTNGSIADEEPKSKAEVADKVKDRLDEPLDTSQLVNVSKETTENETVSNKGEIKMNMSAPQIEPSFSEPISTSLGSLKTQSGIDFGTSGVNITDSGIGITLSPASVSESSATDEHHTISATNVPVHLHVKNEVHISPDKITDVKESLSSSVEQFEKEKKEAMEKLSQVESAVKIGSSGNNKESAILKLKSRVKELASNLSLSTLYLEEMSKRYGTALEEQQKQFKTKINLLNQTVAKNKDVIDKQQKLIEELTRQVMILSLRLQNLTDVTREHNLQMTERYAFTCMVEAFIIIIVLYTCLRTPRVVQQPMEQRRHSAPSTYNHFVDEGALLDSRARSEKSVADQRPSNHDVFLHLENNVTNNTAYNAMARRKRQRRKKLSEGSLLTELQQSDASSTKETTIVSNTAGVLFSAGKGIFSGLTGAFSKQKKPIASRQTRALIDSTEYERVKSLGRSKSLSTIEEDDVMIPPHRHQSFENIRSNKYKKAIARFPANDKKRG